jgi:hypothetical protein
MPTNVLIALTKLPEQGETIVVKDDIFEFVRGKHEVQKGHIPVRVKVSIKQTIKSLNEAVKHLDINFIETRPLTCIIHTNDNDPHKQVTFTDIFKKLKTSIQLPADQKIQWVQRAGLKVLAQKMQCTVQDITRSYKEAIIQ